MNIELNKKSIAIISAIAIVVILVATFLATRTTRLGAAGNQTYTYLSASSTAYTVTTASQLLLASSTPTKRVAATFQTVNCTAGGTLYLRLGAGAAATAATGIAVTGSSTLAFKDYGESPVIVQGTVTGIVDVGTCTVLVNEWRNRF